MMSIFESLKLQKIREKPDKYSTSLQICEKPQSPQF